MEISQYNTFVQTKDGVCIAFNNVSGTLIKIGQKTKALLTDNLRINVAPPTAISLLKNRFLVLSQEQEEKFVTDKIREYRHSSKSVKYTLVLTYGCNLNCPYCYEDSIHNRKGYFTLHLAKAFVKAAKHDLKISRAMHFGLTLYGGEPLLNINPGIYVLRELKDYCDRNKIKFTGSIITNGTLLTEEILQKLSPFLQYAQLTLEGGPKYHNSIRYMPGGKATFTKILNSIELFLRYGFNVAIRIQVTPKNIISLNNCLRELEKRDFIHNPHIKIYFFPILDIKGVCSTRSFTCSHQYYDQELFQHLWPYGEKYGITVTLPLKPVWLNPFCSFVNKWCWIVDPQGNKYKCVSMIGVKDAIVGNIFPEKNKEKKDIYLSREKRFVERSGIYYEECRRCEYLPVCDLGCAYMTDTKKSGNNSFCKFRKEVIQDQIINTYENSKRKSEII